MIELNGRDVMVHLKEKRGAWVKVKYINEMTPVYEDEEAFVAGSELPETEYIKLDYDVKEEYVYGNYPSSLDETSVAMGVSADCIKGWLDGAGELWIIGIDDVYNYKHTKTFDDLPHLCLLHLPTGNTFISTEVISIEVEFADLETRISTAEELCFDCDDKALLSIRLTDKIIHDCVMWQEVL